MLLYKKNKKISYFHNFISFSLFLKQHFLFFNNIQANILFDLNKQKCFSFSKLSSHTHTGVLVRLTVESQHTQWQILMGTAESLLVLTNTACLQHRLITEKVQCSNTEFRRIFQSPLQTQSSPRLQIYGNIEGTIQPQINILTQMLFQTLIIYTYRD